ncbi:hypothetical protein CSOJ01_05492 [Colletotrichum sojae]|uniref:Uncharacterized protein n=1 Tax=Colletotrichum sojae TaxID=2175907 RepID=A0A8H6JEP1_9PEZI|nr:hypothetical protein CSOJ01_05492 [Colletotrichum sojae]
MDLGSRPLQHQYKNTISSLDSSLEGCLGHFSVNLVFTSPRSPRALRKAEILVTSWSGGSRLVGFVAPSAGSFRNALDERKGGTSKPTQWMPSHVVPSSIAVLLPASSMAMTTEEFFHYLYRIEMRRHQGSVCQSTRVGNIDGAANVHVAHWLGGSRRIAAWTNERERSHMAPRHVLDASPTSGRITVPTWRGLGMKSYSDKSRRKFAEIREVPKFEPPPAAREVQTWVRVLLALGRHSVGVTSAAPRAETEVGDPAAERDVCLAAPPIIIRPPPTVLPLAILLEAHWQSI